MDKKTVLLTGIAQGLGKYLAIEFINNKYKVIGVDIQESKNINKIFLNKLENYYQFDLREIRDIGKLIKRILKNHKRIDILINNAGIKTFKTFNEYNFDEIENIYKVNLIAPIILSKCLLPIMRKNNFGRIINISSNAAFKGYKNASIYSSSKSGLNLFTESVSEEIGNLNITINSICPSTIATPEFVGSLSKKDQKKLIDLENVSKKLFYIINSGINGKIFPVIKFKAKMKYVIMDIIKYFKWLFEY